MTNFDKMEQNFVALTEEELINVDGGIISDSSSSQYYCRFSICWFKCRSSYWNQSKQEIMRESMKFSNEFAAVIISASGIVGLLVGVAIGLASII